MPKDKDSFICYGTGLITLDLVINGEDIGDLYAWAGGSCGNVLTILSYLGWTSRPLARLGKDVASKTLVKDMTSHGVDFKYVTFDNSVHTPIIIQRILTGRDGQPKHRFFWICPNCGNWLPRYSPLRLIDIQIYYEQLKDITCFYFDRVSPASLRLAEKAKEKGALIVFEPTSIKDDPHFKAAINLCDILKYSNERTKTSPQRAYESKAKLVVETLGSEGLRYRFRKNNICGKWKLMPAFRVHKLKDSAGAGDWCTAGLIDKLATNKTPITHLSEKIIENSLRYGQALSALNCSFTGPRGIMYGMERSCFDKEIQSILKSKETCTPSNDILADSLKKMSKCVCPACRRK